ncbi:MAG: uracil-DNA glycosylase family protein [Candidatus Bipolaricaulis sp.]|nr:uracil-DNA glycosylase family protein [Candidatus Bipolaricaulis sp.]
MRPSDRVVCPRLACVDVDPGAHSVPAIDIAASRVSVVVLSEAAAPRAEDDYYAGDEALFAQTTLQAFRDAGVNAASVAELLRRGIYFTTAVKCAKTAYGIQSATVRACSELLERELALFPNVRVILLMGDVAIKALCALARRAGEPRPIPAGSTYKLRGPEYTWRGVRVFPSYLQAGPSFFIEKSKRRMIAEDIAAAIACVS